MHTNVKQLFIAHVFVEKQHFCFEIVQYEQTLNTHTSDGTVKKLANTQEKLRQLCWLVCVHSQLRFRTVYGTLH